MNQSGKRFSVGKLFHVIFSMLLIATLVACGGGGGASGSGTVVPGTDPVVVPTQPTLTLTLLGATGLPVASLAPGEIGTIKAVFATAKGVPVEKSNPAL